MQTQKTKYTNSYSTTNKIVEEENYAFMYFTFAYYYLMKELNDIIIEANIYSFSYDPSCSESSEGGLRTVDEKKSLRLLKGK